MKITHKKGGAGTKVEGSIDDLRHLPPLENVPMRKKPKIARKRGKRSPLKQRSST